MNIAVFRHAGSVLRSKVIHSTGVYLIANLVNAILPFLVLPIFARHLALEEFGHFATFQVLVALLIPFAGLSIQGAIVRQFYEENTDIKRYIGNCLNIFIGSSIALTAVVFLGRDTISQVAVFPVELLWGALSAALAQAFGLILLSIWQVEKKPIPFAAFQITQSLLNAGISLYLVTNLGLGWEGRLFAQVGVSILAAFIALIIFVRRNFITLQLDPVIIKSALAFGLPLIPHTLFGWITGSSDRLFINHSLGMSQAGIYAIAFQIAGLLSMLQYSFNNAWVPWFYENLNKKNSSIDKSIVLFSYAYTGVNITLAIVGIIATELLLHLIFPTNFSVVKPVLTWLFLARAIDAMYFMTCNYIFFYSKTTYISTITFASGVVHLSSLAILIHLNGLIGVGQAAMLSSLFRGICTWYVASTLHRMPWAFRLERGRPV